jgi:hypothetical protein
MDGGRHCVPMGFQALAISSGRSASRPVPVDEGAIGEMLFLDECPHRALYCPEQREPPTSATHSTPTAITRRTKPPATAARLRRTLGRDETLARGARRVGFGSRGTSVHRR